MDQIINSARAALMAEMIDISHVGWKSAAIHDAFRPLLFKHATSGFIRDEKLLADTIAQNAHVLDAWEPAEQILDQMGEPDTWQNRQAACICWYTYHELERHISAETPVIGPHIVFVEIEDDTADLAYVI